MTDVKGIQDGNRHVGFGKYAECIFADCSVRAAGGSDVYPVPGAAGADARAAGHGVFRVGDCLRGKYGGHGCGRNSWFNRKRRFQPVVQTGTQTYTPTGYTAVTDSLYYADDSLGTISISEIGLTVKVYQGTSDAALKKGAGHFSSTSIWNGNAAFAAHNRGVTNHFGNIHTLSVGDEIVYKTKLGSRTYEVYSVAKIAVDDVSVLNDTADNIITLITCVRDQPAYRWCVQAKCIG